MVHVSFELHTPALTRGFLVRCFVVGVVCGRGSDVQSVERVVASMEQHSSSCRDFGSCEMEWKGHRAKQHGSLFHPDDVNALQQNSGGTAAHLNHTATSSSWCRRCRVKFPGISSAPQLKCNSGLGTRIWPSPSVKL